MLEIATNCSDWRRCADRSVLGTPRQAAQRGLIIVGGINLGGSIDPIHNPIDVVDLALEKGAAT
jgi:ATP-dependent Lon protease